MAIPKIPMLRNWYWKDEKKERKWVKNLENEKSISKSFNLSICSVSVFDFFFLSLTSHAYVHIECCMLCIGRSLTVLPENQIKTAIGESNWNVILTRDTQRNRLKVSFGKTIINVRKVEKGLKLNMSQFQFVGYNGFFVQTFQNIFDVSTVSKRRNLNNFHNNFMTFLCDFFSESRPIHQNNICFDDLISLLQYMLSATNFHHLVFTGTALAKDTAEHSTKGSPFFLYH